MISRRGALATGTAWLTSTLPFGRLPAYSPAPQQDGRIRLANGRWLSYREYGDPSGPLVFYFHGIPGSRLEVGLCNDEICNVGRRIVAVDRPGIGRSSYYSCRRILDWPKDIEQLADALGHARRPFGVIGFSGGAPYAAACAVRISRRLTHVAIVSGHAPLCAPGTCPGNQDELIALVTRRPKLARFAFRMVDRRLDRRPDKVVGQVTKKWTVADRQLVLCDPKNYRQLVANLNEATLCGPEGLVADIRLLACDWGYQLREIQDVPVSIWQGGCDRIVTPSMAQYFHQQIADSTLMIDPQAGHITTFKWHVKEILSRFPV